MSGYIPVGSFSLLAEAAALQDAKAIVLDEEPMERRWIVPPVENFLDIEKENRQQRRARERRERKRNR